jgi:NTE family protein
VKTAAANLASASVGKERSAVDKGIACEADAIIGPKNRPLVTKRINLALQGGGIHGAFTSGALGRLLEEERIEIEGISATSAGAMNATVLASGFATGGRDGVRAALAAFWRRLSFTAMTSPLNESRLDCTSSNRSHRFSPASLMFDLATHLFSPYEFNPLNLNPLRDVVEASIDFEALRESEHPIKLFLSATNVRTGKVKVFERHEITVQHVLASGCLPFMFQVVEIDGEHYWDGGYMSNPAIERGTHIDLKASSQSPRFILFVGRLLCSILPFPTSNSGPNTDPSGH